jgi:predicted dehydrogenase
MVEMQLGKGQVAYLGDVEKHVPGVHDPGQKEVILLEQKHAKPTEIEMSHFIECIETGKKPLTDAVSSLEGLKVIWELYEAGEKNIIADLQGMGLGSMNFD